MFLNGYAFTNSVNFCNLFCRPFYVSTTTSTPRDVVVVLEISASMRGDKLFQARHAALTVMETLSVKDRVSIPQCPRQSE